MYATAFYIFSSHAILVQQVLNKLPYRFTPYSLYMYS